METSLPNISKRNEGRIHEILCGILSRSGGEGGRKESIAQIIMTEMGGGKGF